MRIELALAACLIAPGLAPAQTGVVAIAGGTVIDGNGGPPLADAVIVVSGSRISAAGPRASVRIPDGATVIDAKGRYVVPGSSTRTSTSLCMAA